MKKKLIFTLMFDYRFEIRCEADYRHQEPHVHVVESGKKAVFSLKNGRCLKGRIHHSKKVAAFLRDASNREQFLRRYKSWNEEGTFEKVPDETMNIDGLVNTFEEGIPDL